MGRLHDNPPLHAHEDLGGTQESLKSRPKHTRKLWFINLASVVLAILALVAAMGVLMLLAPNVIDPTDRECAEAIIYSLCTAASNYEVKFGEYPSSLDDLIRNPKMNFLDSEETPKDPWDRSLVYACPGGDGRAFDIISLGADGQPGGEGEDADIMSWDVWKIPQ